MKYAGLLAAHLARGQRLLAIAQGVSVAALCLLVLLMWWDPSPITGVSALGCGWSLYSITRQRRILRQMTLPPGLEKRDTVRVPFDTTR